VCSGSRVPAGIPTSADDTQIQVPRPARMSLRLVKVIFWAVCRSMKPLVIGVWCGWLDFSFCDVRVGQRLRSLGRRHQESIREVPRHRHRVLARLQAYRLNLCTRSICRHDLVVGRMSKPNRMSMFSRKLAWTSDGGVRSILITAYWIAMMEIRVTGQSSSSGGFSFLHLLYPLTSH
jgi:hypothetical protein